MVWLRQAAMPTVEDGVPTALTTPDDPVWESSESAAEYMAYLDLEPLSGPRDAGPMNRCYGAGLAWAKAAGVTRQVSWGTGVDYDLPMLRSLGVWAGTGRSGLASERLRAG